MVEPMHRREFLQRAAVLIPVMHAGGLATASSALARASDDQEHKKTNAVKKPPLLARLRLKSHKIDAMEKFYRDTLNLAVKRDSESSIKITCGESELEFSAAGEDSHPFYHFAFNIPHNKLNSAIAWMKARAPLVKKPDGDVVFHFGAWDADAIYFDDPSGNIVEFIARHTLKNDKAGEFGVEDILCASEIGVVTPDVAKTAERLKTEQDMEQYKVATDQFAAVGDELGLFIVVRTGRRWAASDKLGYVYATKVEVNGSKSGDGAALHLVESQLKVIKWKPDQPSKNAAE